MLQVHAIDGDAWPHGAQLSCCQRREGRIQPPQFCLRAGVQDVIRLALSGRPAHAVR